MSVAICATERVTHRQTDTQTDRQTDGGIATILLAIPKISHFLQLEVIEC
jgi:hypothetical protein